ncbi:MAG: thioredoxin domain-containing protein [Desulfobacterales bacterium]|nr:thioredoxin domain-containing protein [Desulfobacterales bacterium]
MYCQRLVPLLEQVLEKNPVKVKIVFKNFPLQNHKFAEKAAAGALAADRQGKFWPFHDRLFDNYNRLSDEKIQEVAVSLGLNMEAFNNDLKNPGIQAKIRQDFQDGNLAGVRGTPAVYINGRILKNRTLAGFQEIIDKELGKISGKK